MPKDAGEKVSVAKRAYFGTDGIRGRANSHPMTAEVALRALEVISRSGRGALLRMLKGTLLLKVSVGRPLPGRAGSGTRGLPVRMSKV